LWFVENYLPQNKRASRKELLLDTLEAETINQIQKFASVHSKSFTEDLTNTKITFTAGSWASIPKFVEANRTSQVETFRHS